MDFLKRIIVWALTLEARLVLRRYRPKIVAVTGSVGKTTTKDAIYAALSDLAHVRKSEKSFNSDIGVPLTILGCENAWKNPIGWVSNLAYGLRIALIKGAYPQWLVVEVGADRPGDIRRIARWLRPDVTVITGVPGIPVHVEYFSSPDELAREKRTLAEYAKPGGKLVLNGDDTRMVELCNEFRGMMVKYGTTGGNHFIASDIAIEYGAAPASGGAPKPQGMRFRVERGGSSFPVSVRGTLGLPRAYAALAALAVAEVAGIDSLSAARSLAAWEPPPGRMRILDGANGSVVIDDTYNSSPAAALSALDTLAEVRASRRIAVLGDMLELGKYSAEAHRAMGARAAAVADKLLTIGFRARAAAEAALDAGLSDDDIRQYEQKESRRAGEELYKELRQGDVVLVKGSQSMRMERAVEAMLDDPDRAPELLVRQDPEWRSRP